jgi:hypothetical protein
MCYNIIIDQFPSFKTVLWLQENDGLILLLRLNHLGLP